MVAACSDPGTSSSDGGLIASDALAQTDAVAIADASMLDAAATNSCSRTSLGLGLRPDIAYASNHFAVARYAFGLALTVTQFDENGLEIASTSTPSQKFGTLPPALAGRESFLLAYAAPDTGAAALVPLAPGGSLGTPVEIPTVGILQTLALDASGANTEFGFAYNDEDGLKFARVSAQGTVLSGPSLLGDNSSESLRGISYRDGGWAVIARTDAAVRLHILDNDGVIEATHNLPDNQVIGGIVGTGSEVAVSGWNGEFELSLHQIDNDVVLGPAYYPGGIVADGDGFAIAYVDSNRVLHVLHTTTAGVVNSDRVLGSQLPALPLRFPELAISPSGTRAVTWTKDASGSTDPEIFFGLDCEP